MSQANLIRNEEWKKRRIALLERNKNMPSRVSSTRQYNIERDVLLPEHHEEDLKSFYSNLDDILKDPIDRSLKDIPPYLYYEFAGNAKIDDILRGIEETNKSKKKEVKNEELI